MIHKKRRTAERRTSVLEDAAQHIAGETGREKGPPVDVQGDARVKSNNKRRVGSGEKERVISRLHLDIPNPKVVNPCQEPSQQPDRRRHRRIDPEHKEKSRPKKPNVERGNVESRTKLKYAAGKGRREILAGTLKIAEAETFGKEGKGTPDWGSLLILRTKGGATEEKETGTIPRDKEKTVTPINL